jgi:phosphohistidine phosphatase
MDVYLVQHGQAHADTAHPLRPLTDEGRAAVDRVAEHLQHLAPRLISLPIRQVCHSGKLRSQQTAEILARALCPEVQPTAWRHLVPNGDPRQAAEHITQYRYAHEGLLIAGHLPHLSHLAGMLVARDPEAAPVKFVNAGVLQLMHTETGWAVGFYLTPDCLR